MIVYPLERGDFMSLTIEQIDKSKGLVQPKELSEIHRGVLEILKTLINSFINYSRI